MPIFFIDVCMPLPLRRETYPSIRHFLAVYRWDMSFYIRFLVGQYRFACNQSPSLVDTYYRPVIHPFHGLQVDKATVSAYILEVEENQCFSGRVSAGSLMRSIDGRITLRQYGLPFMGDHHILRNGHCQPVWHRLPDGEDIIITVFL